MAEQGKFAGGELARMIQACVDDGITERELYRRTVRASHPMSNSQFNRYRHGVVTKVPAGDQMKSLAAGLRVDERTIHRAVIIDWFGCDPAEIAGMPLRSRFPDRVRRAARGVGREAGGDTGAEAAGAGVGDHAQVRGRRVAARRTLLTRDEPPNAAMAS